MFEQKLLESIYREVSDCLCLLVVGSAGEYRFVSANDAYYALTGFTPEQVIGKSVTEVIPDNSLAQYIDSCRTALSEGRTVKWDEEVEYPAGKRLVSATATPVDHVESGTKYLSITIRDLAPNSVMASFDAPVTAQYASVVDSLPAQIAVVDSAGSITAVNREWTRFAIENGFAGHGGGVGGNCLEVAEQAWGGAADEAVAGIRGVVSGELPAFTMEYPRQSPDEKRWFRLMVAPLDPGGQAGAVLMQLNITAEKATEAALLESEGRYRRIVDNSPLTIYALDRNGIFTISEGKGLEATGRKPGELVGQSAFDLYSEVEVREHSGKLTFGKEVLARVFAGETVSGVTKNSGAFFENRWIPVFDENGNVAGMTGVAINITERMNAQNDLRRSEELFRSMIEHGSDIISLHDVDGAMVYQSPSVTHLLGYAHHELIGKKVIEYIHEDDRESTLASIELIRSAPGVHPPFETRFRHRNGDWIWFECTGTNLLNNLEIGRILFNARDINDRKQIESALRQSENLYRETVEGANDTIYKLDFEGNFVSVNRAGERLTGYSADELRKMKYKDIIAPEYLAFVRDKMAEKAAAGRESSYLVDILTKDRRRKSVEVNSRVLERDGIPTGILGIARDVTERKHAEDRLREIEQQLAQAQRLESVGLLAGGIAHDFNNLLTAINGYSELILRQISEEDPIYGKVVEIKKAGDRAADLTYQLLAFSRKQILRTATLNINDIVTDVAKMLERLIGENIDLLAVLNERVGSVESDPGQLSQVIVNLAVNARDAMPDGGKLTIETDNVTLGDDYAGSHTAVKPGKYVVLSVTDNGIGMDAETMKRIFEPFFTTKEVGKGTGMGLATVYGIVKQSGGNIWAYSEIGKGTTVKVYLPMVVNKDTEAIAPPAESNMPVGSETLLLVEDDKLVRNLATEILTLGGYTVVAAADGGEASELFESEGFHIDLLVTDLIMPVMSGLELAHRCRQLDPALKVLFISGYTHNAIVHQGALEPGMHFIQKPFNAQSFAQKVRDVLDS